MISYDYLAEFAVVARTSSMSKAALNLSVSQSSLSRHIKSLETSLGMQLLVRTPSGIELTENGTYVANKASDIIDIADDIAFHASKERHADRLQVYGVGSLRHYEDMLNEAAARISEGGRPVQLVFIPDDELADQPLRSAMEFGDVRIYFAFSTDPGLASLGSQFKQEPSLDMPVVAVMEPANPLAGESVISCEQLGGATLLHATSRHNMAGYYWENLKTVLRSRHVNVSSQTRSLRDDSDWLNDMGHGIVLLPAHFDKLDILRSAGKRLVPVEGLRLSSIAVYRADDETSRRIIQGMAALTHNSLR